MKKTYHVPTSEVIALSSDGVIAISLVPDGEADPGKDVLTNKKGWEEDGCPDNPFPWE